MAKCPNCGTNGALILFSKVECPSKKCQNFVGDMKKICGCCGQIGHVPSEDASATTTDSDDKPAESSPPHEATEEQPANNCLHI